MSKQLATAINCVQLRAINYWQILIYLTNLLHYFTGDSLTVQNSHQFTTKNCKNGVSSLNGTNSAILYHGAWWFKSCHDSNLNWRYRNVGLGDGKGVIWYYCKIPTIQ